MCDGAITPHDTSLINTGHCHRSSSGHSNSRVYSLRCTLLSLSSLVSARLDFTPAPDGDVTSSLSSGLFAWLTVQRPTVATNPPRCALIGRAGHVTAEHPPSCALIGGACLLVRDQPGDCGGTLSRRVAVPVCDPYSFVSRKCIPEYAIETRKAFIYTDVSFD